MKRASKTVSAFSLVEVLVAVAVLGTLAFLGYQAIHSKISYRGMNEVVSNARSLLQATQMMTLDSQNAGKGLQWTSSVDEEGGTTPVSASVYFNVLVERGYLTKSELRKILTAPGIGPGRNAPNAGNICFKIFQVEDTSPSDQPFLVTANWQDRQLTDNPPYGRKGFVVFNKGGGGGFYKRQEDAASTNSFPDVGGGCGVPYTYVTLK